MSDVKMYTEEEVRRREREAFAAGSRFQHGCYPRKESPSRTVNFDGREISDEAKRRYPIIRPRVVAFQDECRWAKVIDGRVCWFDSPSCEWHDSVQMGGLSSDDIRIVADLLDNPYEEVTE